MSLRLIEIVLPPGYSNVAEGLIRDSYLCCRGLDSEAGKRRKNALFLLVVLIFLSQKG